MLDRRDLEVTTRNGRVMAAYLTFDRQPGETRARSARVGPGLVADYAVDGRPIGLEITAPSTVTLATINQALQSLGQPPATVEELAPLFGDVQGTATATR